ncbi:hypothetical protein Tco_0152270 [Tanacetum coccineum]
MLNLKFAETHNLVVFLEKPEESVGFEGIIDFLNASSIRYALTVNPTIYTSCIKHFWANAKAKTINGEVQIQALIDMKKVIVTETSARRALQLKDAKEPMADETENVESVPTHSNDPLLNGEDRLKLNELMKLCTNLSQRLERRNKSRTLGLKRLRKVGRSAQVVSSEDEGLGTQDDASKQGRKIVDLDVDVEEVEVEKTLIEIKAAKPKAIITAATTTTTTDTRPKARGVVVQEPKIAQKIQAQINAELEEEEKLAKQKEEDVNIAEWDNVQAVIDAYYELAARLQAQEQEELTIEEKLKLFVELMDKRKKHFARLRAEEQRRKPPTKAQKRNQMCTYLKNIAGFTYSQLKNKSFDEVQKAFDKTMGWIDSFVSMDSEVVKGDDDQEEAEMKKHMEIVVDEEEIVVDAIPLATKPPIIVDWKIIKEEKMGYFQLIRADGSSRRYSSMIKMLQNIDREDLETLWKLVKAKHGNTRPEEAYERVLWGDLKVMFEPDVEVVEK